MGRSFDDEETSWSGGGASGDRAAPAVGQAAHPAGLAPASVFAGRYQLLEMLGSGGMGMVYKALDLDLDKIIALKTIRRTGEGAEETIERFKQELLLAQQITHKNVIRIHDLGEDRGVKFFTMELVEGTTLKDHLNAKGRLDAKEVEGIARQILAGLAEAHRKGIVHRDLKPQNIMLDSRGTVRIMDFGIARSVDAEGMTASGSLIGTPDYMSPEQARGERAAPSTDVYSVGTILFELLTGELPFPADNPIVALTRRLKETPRAPRSVVTSIPRWLEGIVLKCLERVPTQRYQDAQEVLADLDESRGFTPAALLARARRRVRPWMALAAVTLVLAAVALILISRPPAAAPPTKTLALLPLYNVTGAEDVAWLTRGVPDLLATDFAASPLLRPLPAERVAGALAQLDSEETRLDSAALSAIASSLRADVLLYGQFVSTAGAVRFDLTLHDAARQEALPVEKVEGPMADLVTLLDRLADRVESRLQVSARAGSLRLAELTSPSPVALAEYVRGGQLLVDGDFAGATEPLTLATRADPDFALAWSRLAAAYQEAGDGPQAALALSKAEQLAASVDLPAIERHRLAALGASIRGQPERAARANEALLELYPDDPIISRRLATLYEQTGDFERARELLRRSVDPANE
jgi:TolB-like protein